MPPTTVAVGDVGGRLASGVGSKVTATELKPGLPYAGILCARKLSQNVQN